MYKKNIGKCCEAPPLTARRRWKRTTFALSSLSILTHTEQENFGRVSSEWLLKLHLSYDLRRFKVGKQFFFFLSTRLNSINWLTPKYPALQMSYYIKCFYIRCYYIMCYCIICYYIMCYFKMCYYIMCYFKMCYYIMCYYIMCYYIIVTT